MNDKCPICGLSIQDYDRLFGRVGIFKGNETHSYCRTFVVGAIPECPLSIGLQPLPECPYCCQAMNCNKPGRCGCKNMNCQIGKSVRALRKKGIMP